MKKIEDELYHSYFEYTKHVIEDRALPNMLDGCKSVNRRIIYTMYSNGINFTDKKKKSVKIVGDVMGSFHPHGDQSIYHALVRMAQPFIYREKMIIGQGNFGSIDGDNPAAMRYTEAKLSKYAGEFFKDFYADINPMKLNYDGTLKEPEYLPTRVPNLLINGSHGIAVGISTSIPTHNINEVMNALLHLLDNSEATLDNIMEFIKGPDLSNGCIVSGTAEIRKAYETGEGNMTMRANYFFEKDHIIFDQVPYLVQKADIMRQLAIGITSGKIEGISSIKDESDRTGIRIALKIKNGYIKEIIVNQVYSHTALKGTLRFCFFALNEKWEPKIYTLMDFLRTFLKFRERIIISRTLYFKEKNKKKMHLLIGLSIAIENLDEIMKGISTCQDISEARQFLNSKKWNCNHIKSYLKSMDINIKDDSYELSPEQTKGILDLKLHHLVKLEINKIENELTALKQSIEDCNDILDSKEKLQDIIREEFIEIKNNYSMERKTIIENNFIRLSQKDLIIPEQIMIIMDKNNYIKRVNISSYNIQNKGGKGRIGSREEVAETLIASTHSLVLMFSNLGLVYAIYGYEIPEGDHTSKGRAIINLLNISKEEKIVKSIILSEEELANADNISLLFIHGNGQVRRNSLSQFTNIRNNGKKYLKDIEDFCLVSVLKVEDNDFLFIATYNGMASCIPINNFRIFGSRDSQGVIGCKLKNDDKVIGAMCVKNKEEQVLTISENGYGKISSISNYRTTKRGSIGVKNLKVNVKSGKIAGILNVNKNDEVMVITQKSNFLRFSLNKLRVYGRNTTGLKLCNVKIGDKVQLIKKVEEDDMEDSDLIKD